MKYTELYARGIKHLDDDLYDIIEALESGESICLCSPNMGDTRLIDYLHFHLSLKSKYRILYDRAGDLTIDAFRSEVQTYPDDRLVVLIPHFPRRSREFIDYFDQVMSLKDSSLQSIIAMEYDFLKSPERYFKSGRAISYVKIRKPLSFELTQSVIDSRRTLNNWVIPIKYDKEIHRLSGGIVGLIKHICGYTDKFGEPDISDMLRYPSIVRILVDMKLAFETLDKFYLKKLGYVLDNDEINGALLERYLQTGSKPESYDLPPTLDVVFSLLKESIGEIVTIDEIHDRVNERGEFSLWAIYKMISRLRKEISDDYEIQNVKGEGYLLKEKDGG